MLLNGYECVYMPNHHKAFDNGCVYEHILKAEEKLKRELKDEEVVHHIDFNKMASNHNRGLITMKFVIESMTSNYIKGGLRNDI